ncbi:SLC13 family permease [Mammaliicoccus stepanovicii]|uniref:Sodium-dependent dicarboxylate transporter SdcS n=1 Tax=Mammaliicoccus stepanovicii TaxID=643214 RepID=A0A239ZJP8_9STAP|nr:sodium-dependent dicarboxylate transporter SdcS [Mammaliicoccus stepanovicii]SNV71345.1 sodium:sulfate symporter [Mammaliicoccus stepanovicii]
MKENKKSITNQLWKESGKTKEMLKFFSADSLKSQNEPAPPPKSYTTPQLIGLILGPLLFIVILLFFKADGLSQNGVFVMAATLWIAVWWITEAIPIPATSLMPLFLFPLGGIMDSATVSSAYGDDIVFLFLGGFIIALAMERWNLHTRIALVIIKSIGTSTGRILLGFMVATGALSMFVSNTAAVMIMIPIGLAIIKEANDLTTDSAKADSLSKFEKSLVLGIGYAGTIGGLGTLIGTPPLIILKGQYEKIFHEEIGFGQWMIMGVPTVIILLAITWLYLNFVKFKHDMKELPGGKEIITKELTALGKTTYEEKVVFTLFILAAFLWVSREFLLAQLPFTELVKDGTISMFIAVILFIIPAKRKFGRILDWSIAKDLPWGILLLFGGGLAVASAITESGLDKWMGKQISGLEGMNVIIIISIVALFVLFLTEITSNTATATMILPILATIAVGIHVHPLALMIPAAMAANCAFMLPVGTPPNAIVFATDKITIREMATSGFWLNLISCVVIVVFVLLMAPWLFGIDLVASK